MAASVPEEQIVRWLVGLIESRQLKSVISGRDYLDRITRTLMSDTFVPAFDFDYLNRKAYALSAQRVLSALDDLECIDTNKSISVSVGEILKPDIIAFSPSTRTIVAFEVKRAKTTEREAITELMGYEQEIRNQFPFSSTLDICFVLVSRDWDTLLGHAAESMIAWSSKSCLCLTAEGTSLPMSLSARRPSSWHVHRQAFLPSEGLNTVDIILEFPEGQSELYSSSLMLIDTALKLLGRTGDRVKSHGFAISSAFPPSVAKRLLITVCIADPIETYHALRMDNRRSSPLSEFFAGRSFASSQVPDSVTRFLQPAVTLLSERWTVNLSNYTRWISRFSALQREVVPDQVEFWGILGDFADDYVTHPAVRHQVLPFSASRDFDWRHPAVALPLIHHLLGKPRPFDGGNIDCRTAFRAGITLSGFAYLLQHHPKDPRTCWAEFETVELANDIATVYHSIKTITVAPPRLLESGFPAPDRLNAVQALISWTAQHLLGHERIHQECFMLGIKHSLLFYDLAKDMIDATHEALLRQSAHTDFARIAQEVVSCYMDILPKHASPSGHWDAFDEFLSAFVSTTPVLTRATLNSLHFESERLVAEFEHLVLGAADAIIHPVFHPILDPQEIDADWQWLKHRIKDLAASGVRYPAIILSTDGTLSVGTIDDGPWHLEPIADFEQEVYFEHDRSGIVVRGKATWEQIIAGRIF